MSVSIGKWPSEVLIKQVSITLLPPAKSLATMADVI